MKLQHDKGLIEALVEANDFRKRNPEITINLKDKGGNPVDVSGMGMFSGILNADKASQLILHKIDEWMEKHGLTVVSLKRSKMVNKWQIGDLVIVAEAPHERHRQVGEVVGCAPFAVMVLFEDGAKEIVSNDSLEFYRIQKGDGHETE